MFILNPYRYSAPANPLLDTYSGAAAAYSLRKLRTAYSGSAIRVRRSSDNTEQDIGFDGNGNLDEISLITFVGAGSGFVTKWYDQSGNNRDAVQSTQASQPRIVGLGVVDKTSSKPTIYFNSQKLDAPSPLITLTHSIFISYRNQGSTGAGLIGQWAPGQTGRFTLVTNQNCGSQDTQNSINFFNSSVIDGGCSLVNGFMKSETVSSTELNLIESISNTGTNGWKVYKNSVFIDDGTVSSMYNGVNTSIGYFGSTSSAALIGYISEIVIYQSYQSTNRTGIESNINSYYSIY